jgi:hypothetical protein
MSTSGEHSWTFWLEYISAARKAHGIHPPVDPAIDPMWVAIDDWFRTIDAATAKAVAEGFIYFTCDSTPPRKQIVGHFQDSDGRRFQRARFLEPRHKRIILRFRHPDGRRFQRTLAIDERFTRGYKPLTYNDFLDLKVALQTVIFYEVCDGPDRKLIFR